MNVLEYLEEGKINIEGIKKIQELIDENEKLKSINEELKESIGYVEEFYSPSYYNTKTYYSKESLDTDYINDKVKSEINKSALNHQNTYEKLLREMIVLKSRIKEALKSVSFWSKSDLTHLINEIK